MNRIPTPAGRPGRGDRTARSLVAALVAPILFILFTFHPGAAARSPSLESPECIVAPSTTAGRPPEPAATPTSRSLDAHEPQSLHGRWRAIARSPFASATGLSVWAGDRMISVAPGSGEAASYRPATDTWTSLSPSPVRFLPRPEALWTGDLMLLVGRDLDQRLAMVATDRTGRWGRLPDPPIGGSVADAAWTGTSVVIVTDGEAVEDGPLEPAAAAVFDLARRAWCEIPRPPVPGRIDLVWTGAELLAFGSPWPADGPMEMSRFDLASDTWSTATGTPLEGGGGGIPLGGALLFLGGPPDDGLAWDAWYDPAADSWHPIDTECPVRTSGSIWTGTLVVGEEYAYEPTTGACFTVPLPPGGALRGSTVVYTGDTLIRWSGNDGEETPARPIGAALVLEP